MERVGRVELGLGFVPRGEVPQNRSYGGALDPATRKYQYFGVTAWLAFVAEPRLLSA